MSKKEEKENHDDSANLEIWQPHDDVPEEKEEEEKSKEGTTRRTSGWTVHEMFNANKKLGVKTSFRGIDTYSKWVERVTSD